MKICGGVMAGASPAIWVLGPAQRAPASGLTDMTGTSWAQAWGVKPAVSPSRLSSGVARRSEWACLAVDVLRDDRQRCACAGDGEVGRGPGVSVHAGADTAAGVFAAHGVGGAALVPLHRRRDRQGWLHRQDIDGCRGPVAASPNRRGRRHPSSQSRRSVARITARRQAKAAKRQSRSARTSTTNRPTALPT